MKKTKPREFKELDQAQVFVAKALAVLVTRAELSQVSITQREIDNADALYMRVQIDQGGNYTLSTSALGQQHDQ